MELVLCVCEEQKAAYSAQGCHFSFQIHYLLISETFYASLHKCLPEAALSQFFTFSCLPISLNP